MLRTTLDQFHRGWVIGQFDPSLFRKDIEVGVQGYSAGDIHEAHYHKIGTEYNIIISGSCVFCLDGVKHEAEANDIIVVEPNEVCEFTAITDTTIVCIKQPSVPYDKFLV